MKTLLAIQLLIFLIAFTTFAQYPDAITIHPLNATAYDEMTLTFDPDRACFQSGSLEGLDSIAIHSGVTYLDGPNWQHVVEFNASGINGQSTILYPTGDGKFSITYIPYEFYGFPDGAVITEICAVFNNGIDWTNDGRDFTPGGSGCMDFFIPIHYLGDGIVYVPEDFLTIQEGINAAEDGDAVIVGPGTYYENILFKEKEIWLTSHYLYHEDTNFINQTIIDGSQLKNPDSTSVVYFIDNFESYNLLIGFTIQNGSGTFIEEWDNHAGGGIFCINSNVILMNCKILNNEVFSDFEAYGGGVYSMDSELEISNTTFNGNNAGTGGGAIFASNSNINFTDNDFIYNQADNGGAFYYFPDDVHYDFYQVDIDGCNFENNFANEATGGVIVVASNSNQSYIDLNINDSYFTSNHANRRSGLFIAGENITFNVYKTVFNYNEADTYVGGASISNLCVGVFNNCLFYHNDASVGGGEYNSGGASIWTEASVDFINCTFAYNTAAYGSALTIGGGGIANSINCNYWGNSNSQISLTSYNDIGGNLFVEYSNLQNGIDSIEVSPESILNWGDGNINQDPLFVAIGDHPCQIDYYSPCINTGIPDTTGLNLPTFDLAGEYRFINGRVDIGAYEWNTMVGIEKTPLPVHNSLQVNTYPNPFSSSTTIEYELNQAKTVIIKFYNQFGKQVVLLKKNQPEGLSQIVWTPKNLPAGIYFFRLQAGEQVALGKVVLMR